MTNEERDVLELIKPPVRYVKGMLIDAAGWAVCRVDSLSFGVTSERMGKMIAKAFNDKYGKGK